MGRNGFDSRWQTLEVTIEPNQSRSPEFRAGCPPTCRLCGRFIRCCGFARVAKNRSLASLPCLMAADSRECQPVTLDVSPSKPTLY